MRILIINGSPAGDESITLQTVHYLEKHFPAHEYTLLNVGRQIRAFEKDFSAAEEELAAAELILFCYPVYTFLAPSQLHRFIELIKESGVDLRGKYATQITTSKHFYDTTAHRYIADNAADLQLKYIRGLSADMEDLLHEEGRRQALDFFRHTLWMMKHGLEDPTGAAGETAAEERTEADLFLCSPSKKAHAKKDKARVVVVADMGEEDRKLQAMVDRFIAECPYPAELVNLRDFAFQGGCLGCFNCASDGTCIYKDGFDSFLRERIQDADATVYAFRIQDHSMGYRFKLYDDRQFCNGHRTVTMGKPVGYLVDGKLSAEENLRVLIEARAEVGGNYLAGIACDEKTSEEAIDRLTAELSYAVCNHYQPPANFYGVGGRKIFRDLIYQMQGLMREDHRFYKENGFYDDFPQKRKGTIAAMYLVGALMKNKKLQKKMKGKMTEGMLMPYQKVLDKAPEI